MILNTKINFKIRLNLRALDLLPFPVHLRRYKTFHLANRIFFQSQRKPYDVRELIHVKKSDFTIFMMLDDLKNYQTSA